MVTVLIVDDAAFMRLTIKMMLEANGFEVVGEAQSRSDPRGDKPQVQRPPGLGSHALTGLDSFFGWPTSGRLEFRERRQGETAILPGPHPVP